MQRPSTDEEAGVIEEAVTDVYMYNLVDAELTPEIKRTVRNRVHSSSPGQCISREHADQYRDGEGAEPPACNVPDEVNLLLLVVLRPEADPLHQEGPVDRSTRVWVRGGQPRIVRQHQHLELKDLLEEVPVFDLPAFLRL